MGKVIPFTGITTLELDPDRVLEEAKGKLEGCVVIGFDDDGDLYLASSYADGGTLLWLLESCKQKLMRVDDD